MPPQSLRSLETIRDVRIGAGSFLALCNHAYALKYLTLQLKPEVIPHLSLLRSCLALEVLNLTTDETGSIDLETIDLEAFREVTIWLTECTMLKSLIFAEFGVSVAVMVTPLLVQNPGQLEELQVEWYHGQDNGQFHQALTYQSPSLLSLSLRGESAQSRDEMDTMVDNLSQLTGLRHLQLREISDNFSDRHITQLAENLTELEELVIGGLGPTDEVLDSLSQLHKLRSLTLTGISRFTADALIRFVDSLGSGNSGLILNIDMADSNFPLTDKEQEEVRQLLERKVGGRLDYTFWRGIVYYLVSWRSNADYFRS